MDQTLSEQLNFTPRPKTVNELYFLAYMDPLTGTYNRNVLEEMREYLDSQALFVTMVDMDNLKTINDKQGHAAGDQAIRGVSKFLKQISEVVFRLGGDEFLALGHSPVFAEIPGASYGTVKKPESIPLSTAMKTADFLMYKMKREKQTYMRKEYVGGDKHD